MLNSKEGDVQKNMGCKYRRRPLESARKLGINKIRTVENKQRDESGGVNQVEPRCLMSEGKGKEARGAACAGEECARTGKHLSRIKGGRAGLSFHI